MKRKIAIIKWNRDRGLLKHYDPKLELRMLSEEAAEFYGAETAAQMLAEYADFDFVLTGTRAKFGSQAITTHIDLEARLKNYTDLMLWVDAVKLDMRLALTSMFPEHPEDIPGLIEMASRIVIENNNKKSSVSVDGKIVKNENHSDPAELIQEELTRLGY